MADHDDLSARYPGWERWSEPAKEELLRQLQADAQRRIWYCERGRACDGEPHDDIDYRHARGKQWPPVGDWLVWLMSSGRGSGKTRAAAEYVRKMTGTCGRIALIGATGPDLRETMIEGESGLIYVCERAGEPGKWEPSRRRFTFANGAIATGFSAEEPDRLRGPQHHLAWGDEPAHWENIAETWDNLLLGLRLGRRPRIAATTTPLPSKWMRSTAADARTVVTRESTYANLANLAEPYADMILSRFEGTRQGRQELHGEILMDIEGALWRAGDLQVTDRVPQLERVVVGVDPAGSSAARADETGIVVVGRGVDGLFYVLADVSGRYTPYEWAGKVAEVYRQFHANVVVAERNYGGEMVRATLENSNHFMKVTEVTSRHGKAIRAEPVEALYEQGRVWHVEGLDDLEGQLLEWVPGVGSSPDRLDALVHAMHAIADVPQVASFAKPTGRLVARSRRAPGQPLKGRHLDAELAPVVALNGRRVAS